MASISHKVSGDRPTNRYYLFSITVELGKKLKYADYGAYQKRCRATRSSRAKCGETVYVKDLPAGRQGWMA